MAVSVPPPPTRTSPPPMPPSPVAPPTTPPLTTAPAPVPPTDTTDSGPGLMRWVAIAVGVIAGLFVLTLVLAVVLARAFPQGFSTSIAVVRDIVIIFLALEGLLIVFALGVLVLQVARLVNLLQNEVKPILDTTQDTVRQANASMKFVGNNFVAPVLKFNGFLAGAGVFLRELGGLRRAVRYEQPPDEER